MSSRRKRRLPSGCAGVAQLVEHRFCKPGAAGSSPASGFSRLSVRATGYPRSMEHPKDVGDRSALAVMLRPSGSGLPDRRAIRREHEIRPRRRRRRRPSPRPMQNGAPPQRICALHDGELICPPLIPEGTFATLPWADRLLRRVLPRHWRCLPSPYRARADVSQGNASSRARTQRPAKANQIRRRLRDRHRETAGRHARTSRVFWCARIFRLTRWSALSIVFVSQARSSAICSYELPSR